MRKVLLIYLYSRDEDGLSLALGFLKAFADADDEVRRHWTIQILHLPVSTDPRDVTASIERAGADLVGFSCYTWNIRAVEEVVTALAQGRKPIVVLGGVEVTPDPASVMLRCRGVDVIVFGEGEATFCALLRGLIEDPEALAQGRLDGFEGIAWRHHRSVHVNEPRPLIEDLSTIPSPYLSGTFGDLIENMNTVPLETVRGCPYTCTYCFGGRGFKTIRAFPLDRVREEVKHLIRMGVSGIEFFDTNMNYDRKRALELFRFLRTMGSHIRFWFELRAELIDEEQARALGALQFFAEVGLQTTNPAALKAIKRDLNKARFETGMRLLLEASIYHPCSYSPRLGIVIDVMAGLPCDSVSDVLETFDYAFRLSPSRIMVAMMRVLPGTAFYIEAKKYRFRFDAGDDHVIRSSSTLSPEDVRNLTNFGFAVYSVYNRLHAVRTTDWLAEQLGIRPSGVFMHLGRLMAARGHSWESLTVNDLSRLLVEICRERGNPAIARKVVSRLTMEMILNSLQFLRETRRAFWSRWLFTLGYHALTFFGGLSPLQRTAPPVRARACRTLFRRRGSLAP